MIYVVSGGSVFGYEVNGPITVRMAQVPMMLR